MTPYVIFWVVLGFGTLGLALYRKFVSLKEDDYLHLSAGEEHLISPQVATFNKLGKIDRWGVGMTIVTVALGLVLAALYLYRAATGQ
jgi:hypothetical protein